MHVVYIFSQEELVFAIQNNLQNQLIIIDYFTVHNLGIILLKKTITSHTIVNQNIRYAIDCKSSLPYIIFAVEQGIKNIIATLPTDILTEISQLAQTYGCKIFSSQEKLIEYFTD